MSGLRLSLKCSGGDPSCAAWLHPGVNGSCVVMAGGAGDLEEQGTDLFAGRFHDAGFATSPGAPAVGIIVGARLARKTRASYADMPRSRTNAPVEAVGEQPGRLIDSGYVRSVPDPNVRQARTVRLTSGVWTVVENAVEILDGFAAWLDRSVGTSRLDALRETDQVITLAERAGWRP